MKLRSPALPLEIEAAWPEIRNNYARQVALKHGRWVGNYMVTEVNKTIEALGKYFAHPDPKFKVATKDGNKKAFAVFVNDMRTKWPELKSATTTSKCSRPACPR